MRASLCLFGFAAASLIGVSIVEIGCSSSSSPAPETNEDASTTDAPASSGDTGTTPPTDAGAACTPKFDATAASLMAPDVPGNSSWTCLQTACMSTIQACSADCNCNNDILTALQCIQGGMSVSTCFGPIISSSDMNDMALLGCLSPASMGADAACPALPAADGGDAGGSATTDAGDGGGSTTDAGDGG